MRELKFRAWSRTMKTFVYGTLGQWYFDVLFNEDGPSGQEDGTDLQVLGLEPWQQCIDRKDVNGKRIYEGDILKCEDLITFVCWDDHDGAWSLDQDEPKRGKSIHLSVASISEVIGNINENSDLLI